MKGKNLKKFAPILIIFPSTILGFIGKPAEMGLSIAGGALFCIFLNIDMFSKFQGPGGIGAELRETIKEAEVTIEKIKKLMKPVVLYTYTELTYGQRTMGIPENKEKQITDNMFLISKELSMETDMEIKEAKDEYIRWRTWDYYTSFISSFPHNNDFIKFKNELEELRDYYSIKYPGRDKISEIISKFNIKPTIEQNIKLDLYLNILNDNFGI